MKVFSGINLLLHHSIFKLHERIFFFNKVFANECFVTCVKLGKFLEEKTPKKNFLLSEFYTKIVPKKSFLNPHFFLCEKKSLGGPGFFFNRFIHEQKEIVASIEIVVFLSCYMILSQIFLWIKPSTLLFFFFLSEVLKKQLFFAPPN